MYFESEPPLPLDLEGILESSHVDLRIAAGESIALLYELAREKDADFEGEDLDQLVTKLKVSNARVH